jgi:hypothetical protein
MEMEGKKPKKKHCLGRKEIELKRIFLYLCSMEKRKLLCNNLCRTVHRGIGSGPGYTFESCTPFLSSDEVERGVDVQI